MSETTTETTEAVDADEKLQTAVEPVESDTTEPVSDSEPDQPDADDKTPNAEAAKWRRRLRETQAELEQVTAQLDAVQRQQVELLIADMGVKPTALWAVVTDVAELLTDDGAIDTDKVTAAVDTARERFGIPKKQKGSHIPGIGNQPAVAPRIDKWKEAFSPKKR